jgi:hypothetical protein
MHRAIGVPADGIGDETGETPDEGPEHDAPCDVARVIEINITEVEIHVASVTGIARGAAC